MEFNTQLYNRLHIVDPTLGFHENMACTMHKFINHPEADAHSIRLAVRAVQSHIHIESLPNRFVEGTPFTDLFGQRYGA